MLPAKTDPSYQEAYFAQNKRYDMLGPHVSKEQAIQHALNQINRVFGK